MRLKEAKTILSSYPTASVLLRVDGELLCQGQLWEMITTEFKDLAVFDFKNAYWRRQIEICLKNQATDFVLDNGTGKARCWMKRVEGDTETCIWLTALSLKGTSKSLSDTQEESMQTMKLKEMSEMAATIAHEINNPLTIIYAKVSSLIEHMAEGEVVGLPEVSVALDKIRTQSERIFKIVNGMRTFSRDSRKDPFIQVPLKKLLDDSLSLVTSRTRDQGIQVEMTALSDELKISCRPSEMIQVFLNLLTNAIDAMKDTPFAKISIDVVEEGDKVRTYFSDTGPGVSPENEEKIFAPFFTTKPVGVGTGIGLSISTRIIASHQGKLKLDRSRGPSCFMIELPKITNIAKAV